MLGAILTRLADGRFHSGEALGEALGVSRAAIWKALKRLEEQGYPLQRVRGKGYRVPRGACLLDPEAIRVQLPAALAARLRQCLIDGEPEARISRRLATIALGAPVDGVLDVWRRPQESEALHDALAELGLGSHQRDRLLSAVCMP